MLERFNPALKIVCLALGLLVVYQVTRLAAQRDPLQELEISVTPILSTDSTPPAMKKETNTTLPKAGPGRGQPQPDLPPGVQARVDRIVQSEILGQIIRPLPMALLGIAGKDAFVRAPNGQTGLMREGDELGGLKLLRIGTNRVLVEHEQQQRELTIFAGFGSEPLIGKEKSP